VQLRAYIEKIRPIDKQLSYQIDKLLRATSVAQSQAAADAAAGAADGDEAAAAAGAAAGGGDDALRYRPNPQALMAKAPLLGDAEGEHYITSHYIAKYHSVLHQGSYHLRW
jgi:U3 small nucleolar RNA-associated protein 3